MLEKHEEEVLVLTYLISAAITPTKIIAGVVVIVVILAIAAFALSRRRST